MDRKKKELGKGGDKRKNKAWKESLMWPFIVGQLANAPEAISAFLL